MAQRFTVDTLEFWEEAGSLSYRPTKAKRISHAITGGMLGIAGIASGLWLVLGQPLLRLTEMAWDMPFGVLALATGVGLLVAVPLYVRDAKRGIQIDSSGEVVHGKRAVRISSPADLETFHQWHSRGQFSSWSVSLREGDRLIKLPWLRFFHEFEADRVRNEIVQFLS